MYGKPCTRCGDTGVPRVRITGVDDKDAHRAYAERVLEVAQAVSNYMRSPPPLCEIIREHKPPEELDLRPIDTSRLYFVQLFEDGRRYLGLGNSGAGIAYFPRSFRSVMTHRPRKDSVLAVRMPGELHAWFRDYADRYGMTMSEIVINFLKEMRSDEEQLVAPIRVEQK